MTREDLKQLRSLMAELEELEQTRKDLEHRKQEKGLTRFAEAVYNKRLTMLEDKERDLNALLERVQFALSLLPSEERRLLELRYVEGKEWLVIAQEMMFSVDYVRGKLHQKALHLLKENT